MMESTSLDKVLRRQGIYLIFFIIVTQSVFGFYAVYGLEPPGAFVVLSWIGMIWVVGDWFMRDSKINKVEWAFDMGFFLYILGPVFLPFYLVKTRGFKTAALMIGGVAVMYFGTYYISYYILFAVLPN